MAEDQLDPTVLDAVSRILERSGWSGLSLSAIAEEAGVSRVTLHRRGTSVENCVIAVLGRASEDLRSSLWPVLTGPGDAATRLRAALEVLCDVAERHAGVLAAVYRRPAYPIPGKPGRTTSFEFIEPFERLMADGIADGSLRVCDPRDDSVLVANTVCWSYIHMRHAHRWPPDKAKDRVIALATADLLPPHR